MTSYKNHEVLTAVKDRTADSNASLSRGLSIVASAVGKHLVLDRWGVPRIVRTFDYTALSRPEVAELKAFLARRRGRVVPCWVPTDNADLLLAQPALANEASLDVVAAGYTSNAFRGGNGRRHIAIKLAGGARFCAKVISCTENPDGTERLALDAAVPQTLPAGTAVSFLTLCRLESDASTITYMSPHVASARLSFVELPKETP